MGFISRIFRRLVTRMFRFLGFVPEPPRIYCEREYMDALNDASFDARFQSVMRFGDESSDDMDAPPRWPPRSPRRFPPRPCKPEPFGRYHDF